MSDSYHTRIRGILRSLWSKRILSSQWDNRSALVSLPLFISNVNISLFFRPFETYSKATKQLNIKAVKGTFWNLLSGTSYENFNAGGTRFFFIKIRIKGNDHATVIRRNKYKCALAWFIGQDWPSCDSIVPPSRWRLIVSPFHYT